MCDSGLGSELIAGATTVLAAGIAVWGGIWAFRRQKEHELVQRRYLDEGLDVVISIAEAALSIYSHNWARCTEIIKTFRDLQNVTADDLIIGFLPLPENRFAFTAHYRVNVIVDSPVIWQVFQLVIAFAQRGCTITKEEIPVGLREVLRHGPDPAKRDETVQAAMQAITELDKDSYRFHIFAQQMNRIARVVEEGSFTFKSIKSLREHTEVKSAVEELEKAFADKLKTDGNQVA
jgi:hypothetical protein